MEGLTSFEKREWKGKKEGKKKQKEKQQSSVSELGKDIAM
jgi:hypothetical protein